MPPSFRNRLTRYLHISLLSEVLQQHVVLSRIPTYHAPETSPRDGQVAEESASRFGIGSGCYRPRATS